MTRALLWQAVSTTEQAQDERESLPVQDAEQREACEQFNWTVVDTLRIPGFSRRYLDLFDFAQGVQQELKQDDGWRLVEHLKRGDFDVFVCRDGDRFGRSQSLFSRIAEDILFVQKKQIYAVRGGGLISEQQGGREWITMQSYRASKEIDDLVYKREMGMRGRAKRGMRLSIIPFPMKAAFDDKGKEIGVEPDRSLQHIVDDAVNLLLEGVAWLGFEKMLYERFGHGRNNRPYSATVFYRTFYHPMFHGHTAWHMHTRGRMPVGTWPFDLSETPPEHIMFFPNTHEPYYSGERAEAIRAELRRRCAMRGHMSPSETKPFSGLLVCAACGYTLNYLNNVSSYPSYRCKTSIGYQRNLRPTPCDNTKRVSFQYMIEWLTPRLLEVLRAGDVDALIQADSPGQSEGHMDTLRAEIAQLEESARLLIRKHVPDALKAIHDEEIAALAETLTIKRARLLDIEQRALRQTDAAHEQRRAIEQLRRYEDLSLFWQEPGRVINQLLHTLFGDYRLVVLDGQIIKIQLALPHYSQRRRPQI